MPPQVLLEDAAVKVCSDTCRVLLSECCVRFVSGAVACALAGMLVSLQGPWHGVARALWSGHAGALWSGCVDRVACGVWSGQWCARFWSDLGRFGAGLLVRCCRVLLQDAAVRVACALCSWLVGAAAGMRQVQGTYYCSRTGLSAS